jgi:Ferritin-like domain
MTLHDFTDLRLDDLDRDGALREAADELDRTSRAGFFAAAVGGVAAAAALARPGSASAALAKGDVAILNYALTLEYLQDAFYTEAERKGALSGAAARLAEVVGAVERAHVQALRKTLGKKAVKRPFFDFRGVTEDPPRFTRTAVAFEDLGTAAYKGQAHRIQSAEVLAAAVAIHSVEARHAAWIRYISGTLPAAEPFDEPKSVKETLQLVRGTKFIVGQPRTGSGRGPLFTG